jgi:hypothetical protein
MRDSFEFLKTDSQLLENISPSFFRNQFLDIIAKNQFFYKKTQRIKHGLKLIEPQKTNTRNRCHSSTT